MKVIMTCGGTGGHINPALAIADTIKKKHPDAEINFVGAHHGKETELVGRAGYPLHYVDIQGIVRSISLQNIKTAYYIATAPIKAAKLLRRLRPDVVIGTGGYACWPSLAAATKMGIPTVVHESNAIPGLAVRKLQNKVDRILINFPGTAEKLTADRNKIICVGNPLRGQFENASLREPSSTLKKGNIKQVVVSFGGSLGALAFNQNAVGFIKECAKNHPEILYVHATGKKYYQSVMQECAKMGVDKADNVVICDYIHDMSRYLSEADVVIARAGAMTISELALMKKAAIIIPSPNVVDDHQYKNAKMLADKGAVVMINEKELDSDTYSKAIFDLLGDKRRRDTLSENIAEFADPLTNERIYNIVTELIKEKKGK